MSITIQDESSYLDQSMYSILPSVRPNTVSFDYFVQSFIKLRESSGTTGAAGRYSGQYSKSIIPKSILSITGPPVNKIMLATDLNSMREFQFNKIFGAGAGDMLPIFRDTVLPLLKTLIIDHLDASLLMYGARNAGKTYTLGSYWNFYESDNLLGRALAYIFQYTNPECQICTVNISCFEVFMNCINDLLVNGEDERKLYADKIKNVTVGSYKEAVNALSYALKKRKRGKGHWEHSQSHLFITIELIQAYISQGDEQMETFKSVLTLVDLVGPEEENPSQDRRAILTHNYYNQTELSEQLQKLISYENNASLSELKEYILSIDVNKYPKSSFTSNENLALTQLLRQNFLTDAKIHILGMAYYEGNKKNSNFCESTLNTLEFCHKFKNVIGKLVMENSEIGTCTVRDESLLGVTKKAPPAEQESFDWALESLSSQPPQPTQNPIVDYSTTTNRLEKCSDTENKWTIKSPSSNLISPQGQGQHNLRSFLQQICALFIKELNFSPSIKDLLYTRILLILRENGVSYISPDCGLQILLDLKKYFGQTNIKLRERLNNQSISMQELESLSLMVTKVMYTWVYKWAYMQPTAEEENEGGSGISSHSVHPPAPESYVSRRVSHLDKSLGVEELLKGPYAQTEVKELELSDTQRSNSPDPSLLNEFPKGKGQRDITHSARLHNIIQNNLDSHRSSPRAGGTSYRSPRDISNVRVSQITLKASEQSNLSARYCLNPTLAPTNDIFSSKSLNTVLMPIPNEYSSNLDFLGKWIDNYIKEKKCPTPTNKEHQYNTAHFPTNISSKRSQRGCQDECGNKGVKWKGGSFGGGTGMYDASNELGQPAHLDTESLNDGFNHKHSKLKSVYGMSSSIENSFQSNGTPTERFTFKVEIPKGPITYYNKQGKRIGEGTTVNLKEESFADRKGRMVPRLKVETNIENLRAGERKCQTTRSGGRGINHPECISMSYRKGYDFTGQKPKALSTARESRQVKIARINLIAEPKGEKRTRNNWGLDVDTEMYRSEDFVGESSMGTILASMPPGHGTTSKVFHPNQSSSINKAQGGVAFSLNKRPSSQTTSKESDIKLNLTTKLNKAGESQHSPLQSSARIGVSEEMQILNTSEILSINNSKNLGTRSSNGLSSPASNIHITNLKAKRCSQGAISFVGGSKQGISVISQSFMMMARSIMDISTEFTKDSKHRCLSCTRKRPRLQSEHGRGPGPSRGQTPRGSSRNNQLGGKSKSESSVLGSNPQSYLKGSMVRDLSPIPEYRGPKKCQIGVPRANNKTVQPTRERGSYSELPYSQRKKRMKGKNAAIYLEGLFEEEKFTVTNHTNQKVNRRDGEFVQGGPLPLHYMSGLPRSVGSSRNISLERSIGSRESGSFKISQLLDDKDRPVLDFEDTRARIKNFHILDANIQHKSSLGRSTSRSEETGRVIASKASVSHREELTTDYSPNKFPLIYPSNTEIQSPSMSQRSVHIVPVPLLNIPNIPTADGDLGTIEKLDSSRLDNLHRDEQEMNEGIGGGISTVIWGDNRETILLQDTKDQQELLNKQDYGDNTPHSDIEKLEIVYESDENPAIKNTIRASTPLKSILTLSQFSSNITRTPLDLPHALITDSHRSFSKVARKLTYNESEHK